SQSFIWTIHCCTALATNPDSKPKKPCAAPIWFCSRWGLPCQTCYQVRGALLPHPFIITGPKTSRPAFCCTVPEQAITPLPAGRYPAPFNRGARTFLENICIFPRLADPLVHSI